MHILSTQIWHALCVCSVLCFDRQIQRSIFWQEGCVTMRTTFASACLCRISSVSEVTALRVLAQLSPASAMAFARCSTAISGSQMMTSRAAHNFTYQSQAPDHLINSAFHGAALKRSPLVNSQVTGRRYFSVSASALIKNTE